MVKKLNYGMVGGSMDAFIGEVHRKAIAFDPRASFVAGCFTRNPEKNQATGEAYFLDQDRIYGTYQEMAEAESRRPDGIDFVCICTPNNTHYAVSKCFLEHGIHVVCEKPLCFTVEEAEELAALARAKGLVFGVTYTYCGYAMLKVMREMIRSGKIGTIATINAEYVQSWLIDELSTGNDGSGNIAVWRADPAVSGISNCVGDIGTHIENTVHYLTGLKLKRVAATVDRYGKTLDMNANMLVEFENGVRGAYWCSQIAAGKLNGFIVRVYGSEGALEWEQHYPDYLKFTPRGRPTETLSRGAEYIAEAAGSYSRIPVGHPEGLVVAFANHYQNIISAILKIKNGGTVAEGEFDYPTVEDGVNGVKFVHAVIRSSDEDARWVSL